VVEDHRGDLVVGLAQRPAEAPEHGEFGPRLQVIQLGQHPLHVAGLVGQGGLGQLQVPLLHGRAQDDLAADAHGGGLGPGGQRRHLDLGVPDGRGAAGQPPAVLDLLRRIGPDVQAGRRGRVLGDPDPALLSWAVAAAGRVDGDAVPAGRVEQGHAVRNPHRPVIEDQIDPNGLGGCFPRRRHVAPWPSACALAASAAFWAARCAAIQLAPHSSRFSTRSAALTARTICGDRASMIALVSPALIAMGRNAAAIVCRSGMPKLTLEAPSVMFTPNSALIIAIVSIVRVGCRVSAPTGMASGSITMSSTSILYFSVATWISLRVSSRRRAGSSGISSSSFGSPITAAPYFFTIGRMASIRSSSAVTELTSALPW